MDLQKSFGVDKDAAENGKWFDMEDGGSVRVAKLGCPKYRAEVQRLSKPHLALLQSSMDSSEIMDKITITAMSRTVLLDWKNINLNGEPVEYSSLKAQELLEQFPDFREVVSAFSVDRGGFKPADIAEK